MKEGLILRQTLKDIRRPQPATPVQTDNSTAAGIANNAIKQNKSRSMDMRYHWVRDKVQQGLFNVYWDKGSRNKADYYVSYTRRVLCSLYVSVDDVRIPLFPILQLGSE